MTIVKINNEQDIKNATISITYEELRDITNIAYQAQKADDKYKKLSAKLSILFDIISEGFVTPFTIGTSVEKGYVQEIKKE